MILSITGDADCCSPTCQGEGCPSPARAASAPVRIATIAIANTVNRLSTNIVGIAPSNEVPKRAPPLGVAARIERDTPRWAPRRAWRDLRGILASQTTIPALSQCTPSISPMRPKGRPMAPPTAVVRPFLGHNALFYSSLTRSPDHGRRGSIRLGRDSGGAGRIRGEDYGFIQPGNAFSHNEIIAG